jgi:hypothetical protein
MLLIPTAVARWNDLRVVYEPCPELDQRERILEALREVTHIPWVDAESLSRYYKYLSEHLCLPFTAHFPKPATSQEEEEFRCTVLELLDPAKYLGDGFDGIFCKTRKGKYEVNLPIIDLYLPENIGNSQLIEDYWRWFWNWR